MSFSARKTYSPHLPALLRPHPDGEPAPFGRDDSNARHLTAAESALMECARRDVGATVPPEKAERNERAELGLLNQTRELVARLRTQGVEMERQTPFELWRYYVHSRQAVRLPQWRRCMVLPWIAKTVRAKLLQGLESFLERHPFARMWIFTAGPRVPLAAVRKTARRLLRRLNRLRVFLRSVGLEIVFQSVELGTPEFRQPATSAAFDPARTSTVSETAAGCLEFDAAGSPLFHVHAHVLVISNVGYIQPAAWSEIIGQVWQRWSPDFWSAGRTGKSSLVREARELCKYLTKPAEMLRVTPADLAALVAQLKRLKLVQPLGRFAVELKRRKRRKLRLDREPKKAAPQPAVTFREIADWDRYADTSPERKELDRVLRLAAQRAPAREPDIKLVARIAGCCAPHATVKEPAVTVLVARFDESSIRSHPLIASLIQATAAQYAAGLARVPLSEISVHKGTPTAAEFSAGSHTWPGHDPPDTKPAPENKG